jgi:hypothetical protein
LSHSILQNPHRMGEGGKVSQSGGTTGISTQVIQFDIVAGINPNHSDNINSRLNMMQQNREPGGVSGGGGTASQLSLIHMSPSPSPF